jgi:hypothetical protein
MSIITLAPGNVVSRLRLLTGSYSNPRRIVLPSVNSKYRTRFGGGG